MNGMEEMGGRETEDAGERQEDARERRKTFGGRLEAVWRPFGGRGRTSDDVRRPFGGRRMTFQGLWEDVWRKYDDFGGNVRILEKKENCGEAWRNTGGGQKNPQ